MFITRASNIVRKRRDLQDEFKTALVLRRDQSVVPQALKDFKRQRRDVMGMFGVGV